MVNASGRIHRVRIVVPLLLLTAVTWAGLAYVRRPAPPEGLVASGTIEATQVSVASKVPGRILRLHAAEGETVRAGMALVTIEGRELQAQLDQARSAVSAAQARRDQARSALALQQSVVAAQITQAQAALDAAHTRRQQAQETRDFVAAQASAGVAQAQAALAAARANSDAAQVNLDKAARDLARLEGLLRDGAVSAQQVDGGRAARDAARAQWEASQKVAAQAEAALRVARANLRQVEIRERDVAAAQAQVVQADAALRTARAGLESVTQRRAEVAAAEAQVAQAEAGVRLLRTQQANLVVASPIAGIVLAKHASAGEIVAAGAPIFTVASLDPVWVRLFIPLPDLGRVALGQPVDVTTDAFPGRTFSGTVTEIAQQAEFTPRNVQTKEERVKLVFAVKVTIANRDQALKPGMPADAVLRTAAERTTTSAP